MMLLAPLLKGNFMKSNFSYKNIVKNFIRPWRNPKMELDNKPLSLLVLLKKGGRTTLKKIGGQISLLINSLWKWNRGSKFSTVIQKMHIPSYQLSSKQTPILRYLYLQFNETPCHEPNRFSDRSSGIIPKSMVYTNTKTLCISRNHLYWVR